MRSLDDRADDSPGSDVVERVQRAVTMSLGRTGLGRDRRKMVVAVSGGADSLCLLDAVFTVTPRAPERLIVGHVDHQLRPSSAADAAQVREIADGYGLPCTVLTVDVPSLMESEQRGIEEAARLGRYRALHGLALAQGGASVLTGHTVNDVAETVLLHLLRGSGLGGLGGISEQEHLPAGAIGYAAPESPPLTLVRPLLNVSRADTVAYCEARRLRWITDESNTDPRMLRNRVRAHLLPVLRTYNPAVDRALTRMAAAVTGDEVWLDQLTERLWNRLAGASRAGASGSTISLSVWRRQPIAAQRRLVRHFAAQNGHWEIGFDAVERALRVGSAGGPARAELGGRLTVERQGGALRFVGHAG